MVDTFVSNAVGNMDLSKVVLAVGALGTAAYGVVDASKGFWGGISNRGFGDITKVVSKCIPAPKGDSDSGSALALPSALATLRANWLNGMALADRSRVRWPLHRCRHGSYKRVEFIRAV